jgi:hypothetical protein
VQLTMAIIFSFRDLLSAFKSSWTTLASSFFPLHWRSRWLEWFLFLLFLSLPLH